MDVKFNDRQLFEMLQVIFAYQKKAGLGWKQLLIPGVRSRNTLDRWRKLRYKEGVGVVKSNGRKVRDDWKQHVVPLAKHLKQLMSKSGNSTNLEQFKHDWSDAVLDNVNKQ